MDMLSKVNWVDILVVIIMLRTIYMSFQNGLSHEIFPLFGAVLKLILALHFYSKLGSVLHRSISFISVSVCNMASFLAIVLIVGFTMMFLKGLVDAIIKVTWHPLIEKIGGMVVGVIKGAISASMVLIFLALVPLSYLQSSIKDKSLYGMLFLKIGPAIYLTVSGGGVDDKSMVREIFSKKDITSKGDKVVKAQTEWERDFYDREKRIGGK
jgi:uncharacterized membrane protein required for colicin V production